MLVKINSATPYGLEAQAISVEVDIASRGLPGFEIIGLAGKPVDESRHRIKTALLNLKIDFPTNKKITVNLAPADLPKAGSCYDLPIATGLICLSKAINPPEKSLFFGEVSLDGTLRHTRGAFLLGLYAQENDFNSVFVPESNALEVAPIPGIDVYPVKSLKDLFEHLCGFNKIFPIAQKTEIAKFSELNSGGEANEHRDSTIDFSDIIGQESAKRSLEIAAAGGHNFLMIGPPGVGKTMLSQAFCGILPPLTLPEALEVTKIYSAGGHIPPNGSLITTRPFRSPHHSISYAGMVGGGLIPKPGEISLAHRGVLFMDEFPEFPQQILEMLRQPLESGNITISRNGNNFNFPCKFVLLVACNPCPCGYFGSNQKECNCTPGQIRKYQRKISGPILDRIDLFTHLDPVEAGEYSVDSVSSIPEGRETSQAVRERVCSARSMQKKRFKDSGIFCNSEMSHAQILEFCQLDREETVFLSQAVSKYSLSARAYFKTIKISRTIADLAGEDKIQIRHLSEALHHRIREI